MISDEQARELLNRYRRGVCSREEKDAIENWYQELLDKSQWDFEPGEEALIGVRIKTLMNARLKLAGQKERKSIAPWRSYAAAAIFLVLASTGSYLLFSRHNTIPAKTMTLQLINDVPPGSNKAVLTLSNGIKIILDSAHNGMLVRQGNSVITKMDSGFLAYQTERQTIEPKNQVTFNTLVTPRGGKYQLVLSDGSKAWLNAASSIRFPTTFTGKRREVEVTGEVYFEIAKNAKMPFIVKLSPSASKSRQDEIQVLGTHFNVNAYQDELAVKVTLLEGSVRVKTGDSVNGEQSNIQEAVIIRGQQAALNKEGQIKLIRNVDTQEVIAWKNGVFRFDSMGLEEIMRQISRWYNVEIRYEGSIKDEYFTGSISRNENVSKVLKMLGFTNTIQFRMEGRTITVLPVK